MPMYDKTFLGRKAQELGFVRDTYEKMLRLADILHHINTDQVLGTVLALKGGTAINLAIFHLPRLSVDIDLDFTENLPKEVLIGVRERISQILMKYLSAEGYTLSAKTKQTHALDSFVCSYKNAAGNPDNIKIEINYALRCHALQSIETTILSSEVFPAYKIRILSPVEIYASKIVALSSRAAARDLYDLNNLVYFGLFDDSDLSLLRKCTVLYSAITGDTAARAFNFSKVSEMSYRTIKTDLYPMIRNAEKFDFESAKNRVLTYLSELMILTEREATFMERFKGGRYEPQFLFDDIDIVARIANHPMALWRCAAIRESRDAR